MTRWDRCATFRVGFPVNWKSSLKALLPAGLLGVHACATAPLPPTDEVNNIFDEVTRAPVIQPDARLINIDDRTYNALMRGFPPGTDVILFVEHIEQSGGNCESHQLDHDESNSISCRYDNVSYGFYLGYPFDSQYIYFSNQFYWDVDVFTQDGLIDDYAVASQIKTTRLSESKYFDLRQNQIMSES